VDELKRCPFCGSPDIKVNPTKLDAEDRRYYVRCPSCEARGSEAWCAENAIKLWNLASGRNETLVNEIEKLKEEVEMFRDALRGMIHAYEILEKEVENDE